MKAQLLLQYTDAWQTLCLYARCETGLESYTIPLKHIHKKHIRLQAEKADPKSLRAPAVWHCVHGRAKSSTGSRHELICWCRCCILLIMAVMVLPLPGADGAPDRSQSRRSAITAGSEPGPLTSLSNHIGRVPVHSLPNTPGALCRIDSPCSE